VSGTEAHSERLPFPPVVLGIAGCSGSGKTTLADELARTLAGIHFPLDNYYRDLSHLPLSERKRENFDDPALIESALLASTLLRWRVVKPSNVRSMTSPPTRGFPIARSLYMPARF